MNHSEPDTTLRCEMCGTTVDRARHRTLTHKYLLWQSDGSLRACLMVGYPCPRGERLPARGGAPPADYMHHWGILRVVEVRADPQCQREDELADAYRASALHDAFHATAGSEALP